MFVETACADFLTYCGRERRLSENTLAAYRQDLDEFGRTFAGWQIDAVTGDDLVTYAHRLGADRGLAPATVRRRLAPLKAMFFRLARQDALPHSPFADVDLRVRLPARLPRCLGGGELRALLHASRGGNASVRLAALLLFSTGIRVGELAAIRLGDLDLDQKTIRIMGKGSRERQVFLPDAALVDLLRAYLRAEHPAGDKTATLMRNTRGGPASASTLRNGIKKLACAARIGRVVTPHMLRHTAATALMEAGVDIRFVQRLLGHQNISTTQIYTHVSDRALKAAVIAANVCHDFGDAEPMRT